VPSQVAYLSSGKLHLIEESKPARNIESTYGETIRARLLKSQQRHSWKAEGGGGNFLSGQMLWGKNGEATAAIHVELTSLCSGNVPGHLLYTLQSDSLCGLLSLENQGEYERRLWNNNAVKMRHLSLSPDGDLACSIENRNGTANLGVMFYEKTGLSEVTEGDSYDSAPSWIPGKTREVAFHSAGVGRTKEGHAAGLGAFHIQQLALDSGEMTTLLENPNYDFLCPRIGVDGALYCIQRPHESGPRVKPIVLAKEVLLFPFRFIWAVFQMFNFLSMIFSGKKLTPTAPGPSQTKQLDPKQMMLWGNLVRAQKENAGDKDEITVPKTWKLIRKRDGQAIEILAHAVGCFDLAANGAVIYSDGNRIVKWVDGKETEIGRGELIEQIAIVP
jgi:hypothetical protein